MRTHHADNRTIGQWLALIIGAAFTLAGIAGFFVTGFENFAGNTDKTLFGLEVNPLHNLVHLALGLLGLAMWRTREGARTYGWITFVGYGVVFLYGLFAAGDEAIDFLSLNMADNIFHLFMAFVGLAAALTAYRKADTAVGGYGRTARGTA